MRARTGLAVAVAAGLALSLAACRGQDDEVSTDVGVTSDACPNAANADNGCTYPGVTPAACPNAVNADNGCIYLGVISALTVGPFAPLAVPITAAQKAFWKRVNTDGG